MPVAIMQCCHSWLNSLACGRKPAQQEEQNDSKGRQAMRAMSKLLHGNADNHGMHHSDDPMKQWQSIAMHEICDVHRCDFALPRCGALTTSENKLQVCYRKSSFSGRVLGRPFLRCYRPCNASWTPTISFVKIDLVCLKSGSVRLSLVNSRSALWQTLG